MKKRVKTTRNVLSLRDHEPKLDYIFSFFSFGDKKNDSRRAESEAFLRSLFFLFLFLFFSKFQLSKFQQLCLYHSRLKPSCSGS